LELLASNSAYNWAIRTNWNVASAFEICTSTAGGGSTFGTPLFTLTGTGLNSTVIGATTPAAGTFTSVSSTGAVTSTQTSGAWLFNTSATTGNNYATFSNTSGRLDFGVESSAGSSIITGAGANTTSFSSQGAINFSANNGSNIHATVTSTGLNSTVIGATTPAAGSFTTLSASGGADVSGGLGLVVTAYAANDRALKLQANSPTAAQSVAIDFFTKANRTLGAQLIASATGDFAFWTNGGTTNTANVTSTGLAVTGALSATGLLTVRNSTQSAISILDNAGTSGYQIYRSSANNNAQNLNVYDYSTSTNRIVLDAGGLAVNTSLAVTGALSATGITSTSDTTDATSTTAASLKTAGGLAVAKKAYFGGLVRSSLGFISTHGETGSIAHNTPTTILSISGGAAAARYEVNACVVISGQVNAYSAFATVIFDAGAGRIVANDGSGLAISLSGTNIQVTQTSGTTKDIFWSCALFAPY
jgi:hypothetical protein